MKEVIVKAIVAWLRSEKKRGEFVESSNKTLELDSLDAVILDGSFDIEDLVDRVLKIVSSK